MIEYTTSVTGRAVKAVTCEQCGHEYLYLVRRKGTGTAEGFLLFSDPDGMGSAEAERLAQKAVEKELAAAVEIVPCPQCGRVQAAMVQEARVRHLAWLRVVALIAFALGFIAGAVGFVATMAGSIDNPLPGRAEAAAFYARVGWYSAAGLIPLSFALGYLKVRLNRRIDPNDEDPAVRIRTGKNLAMTREQIAAMLAAEKQVPGK